MAVISLGAGSRMRRPPRAAPIWPTSQGLPTAERPTITAAAPEAARQAPASPTHPTSPRPPTGTAAHRGRGGGGGKPGSRILKRADVAVGDHRNGDGLHDRSDGAPIGP